MKAVLESLAEGLVLSTEQSRQALLSIVQGAVNEAQLSAFMMAYRMRIVTAQEMEGFRQALLEVCMPIDLAERQTIDIVGTGGDGKDTFNISTLSTFVVAGAGYAVTKHGNYGVSSVSGSSNVLEHLGYTFLREEAALLDQLDRVGLTFFHAPYFHPALKSVAPVRKALGMKTFFNILGPLAHPGQPTHQLLGVYSAEIGGLYQAVLQHSGRQFRIVHSVDGYDEASLTSETLVYESEKTQCLSPHDFGLPNLQQTEIYGGQSIAEAAHIFMQVLENKGTEAQQAVVVANAALAIQCMRPEYALKTAVEEAKESITSLRAYAIFKQLMD